MKIATVEEFKNTSYWKYERRIISGNRYQDIYYTDCGTEVASHHKSYTRGKITTESYMVNPEYL